MHRNLTTCRRHFVRGGFTLIEASMAMVIVGVGVVALLELLAAGTMSNQAGAELTTAINLANNVHEITLGTGTQFNWQGTWAAGKSYNVRDVVSYGGAYYLCTSAVSGASAPSSDTTNWMTTQIMAFKDPMNPSSASSKESGGPAAYNDIWDMNGDTYSPPLDIRRQPITRYSGWAQKVAVQTVAPDNVNAVRPNDPTVPTARITVTITHNGKYVYTASWLVTDQNN